MRHHWRNAILVALLIGFAWFVWPTPYRYHYPKNGGVYRENRFTGRLMVLRGDANHLEWGP
jgi:hypothetical protein